VSRPAWITGGPSPRTREGVAAALREGAGAPFVPVGSGAHLERGERPAAPCTALGLDGLDRVVEHATGDLTVTVEAGVRLETLRELLAEHDQWLPPDPGGRGTVGGWIAADRRGVHTGGFGSARDFLIGVTAADGRGRVARAGGRVVKNVAGYDLMKLLTGSLGEFGIILEATFRVLPRPATWAVVTVPEGSGGGPTARQVLWEAPRRWFPAGLFRTNLRGSPELLVFFAGTEDRVAAQGRAAREALGATAQVGDAAAAADLLNRLRRVVDPETGPAGWGGALPGALCGDAVAEGLGSRPWVADLLRGHFWCAGGEVAAPEAARLRAALAVGEGHLHLEPDPDRSGDVPVWGADPGPEREVWQELKRALDPDRRLVAGRLPGGV